MLNLWQVELLWAKNRPRPCNSNPTDESLSGNLVVLHYVKPDQRASTTQPRLTVHSDRPGVWLGEMLLTRIKELVDDVLGRGRSVDEDHVFVVDAL